LVEIQFQEITDAKNVYERLLEKQQALTIDYITVSYDSNLVFVSIPQREEQIINEFIVPVLSEFIITTKEDYWIKSLIHDVFYFSDIEEQNQILQIAQAMIDGGYQDIPDINQMEHREKLITGALIDLLRETGSFSFESFLKFRLRNYTEQLQKYVELAIDEYKLEQEYQNFIQNLRDFVVNRTPKIGILHILHEDQFHFFNEAFYEMKRDDLMGYIDRKLVITQPMYIDSTVIAPLVSIAPESIFIYTDKMDHGMVQTIQNIFLERVQIYARTSFDQQKVKKV